MSFSPVQKSNWLLRILLSFAGWKPCSANTVPWQLFKEFERTALAEQVVGKYYGLKIRGNGVLRGGGACDINIDPALAIGLGSELKQLGARYGKAFFPLGRVHDGLGLLLLAEDGAVYLWGDVAHPLLLGATCEDALLKLMLRGK